jgi:hypothetical protein
VRIDYGEGNFATWPHAGEVRAVVDDALMVVRRWVPRRKSHVYETFTCVEWHVWAEHFHVVSEPKVKRRKAA